MFYVVFRAKIVQVLVFFGSNSYYEKRCKFFQLGNHIRVCADFSGSVGSQLSLSWRTFHFQVDSTENSSDPAKARREMTGGRNSKNENDYGNGNGNERKGARGSRSRPSGRSEARVQPSGKQNGATRRDERGSFVRIVSLATRTYLYDHEYIRVRVRVRVHVHTSMCNINYNKL